MDAYELLKWCEQAAMPLLIKHCPDRIEAVQSDLQRLARLLASKDEVTICFLGNSGVGKSTLLNAIAAGASQILPAGGIGPLTAQATEVRYSEEKCFHVTYHPKKHLWRLAFALETRLQAERRAARRSLAPPTSKPMRGWSMAHCPNLQAYLQTTILPRPYSRHR